ncbi:hypothetical protein BOX15_Mlig028932g1 [Macrostomum lignano]|uniref:DUF4708 domain-containing protein n=1 Tax=Macrostomum lignano TaxID=282301 RepID=A0A267GXM8_9PLAT|nr:hypothetical protein BOX15_Mlig028932g3 [Macrostomum lignano]PAA90062.1 hypothetical protein BOX15_Mlig028932g1 [Macrostomum lignano]
MSFHFNFEPICTDDLVSILVKADRQDPMTRGGSQMVFNLPHVFIARKLILTNEHILVAPSTDPSCTHLVIIGKSDYMKQKEITSRITRLKLTILVTGKTCSGDLEKALKFTIQTRLSKNWAPCADLLIQGQDFLDSRNNSSILSVKVNFCATNSSLDMTLKPVSSILPLFSLDGLGVPAEVSTSFLRTDGSFITEDFIPNRWVYVLPSMKKGEVVEIRKDLPIDSPFNSFEELKIYWLNLYGYKLPSSESDIFYVQVLFRMLSAEPMTYPSCCVRPGGLRPAPSRDRPPTGAVRQFAIDTLSYSRRLFADFQLRLIDPDKDVATVVADNAAASTASQSTAIATASKLQTQKPNAVVPPSARPAGCKRRHADNADEAGPTSSVKQPRLSYEG